MLRKEKVQVRGQAAIGTIPIAWRSHLRRAQTRLPLPPSSNHGPLT